MWTFYVEAIEVTKDTQNDVPKTILSVGEIPKEAPEKEFVAEKLNNEFGDEEDIDEIIDEHLIAGKPVKRLQID